MAGKPNRDRGRKPERAHPHPPAASSVERVDAHTLIVRSPRGFSDEAVKALALLLETVDEVPAAPTRLDTPEALRPRPGVWLTPGEVTALEAGTDVTDP